MGLEHLKDGNYIGGLTMPKEKSNYFKMEKQKTKTFLIKRSPKLTKCPTAPASWQ